MPIYEFYCRETNRIYSFYARSMADAGRIPRCPDNPAHPLERLASRFAISRGGGSTTEEKPNDAASDPAAEARVERAMLEMQNEIASIDEENPDPRVMARMMRKLSSATGEKMPEAMEEMIGRMEAGEDPESLEAEYGDALEGWGEQFGAETEKEGASARRRRQAAPTRDPVLYELRDYLD